MLEILSLGGGVQSSQLLYMSGEGELPRLNAAVFANTKWEPSDVYDHVEYLKEYAAHRGVPVYEVSKGNIRADALVSQVGGSRWASMPLYTKKLWQPTAEDLEVINAAIATYEGEESPTAEDDHLWFGEPESEREAEEIATRLRGIRTKLRAGMPVLQAGIIRRQCTKEYKIEPITAFVRQRFLFLEPGQPGPTTPVIRRWLGISLDEFTRAKASYDRWAVNYHPLVDLRMTRADCIRWCEARGLKVGPRSACIGCPYHSDEEWRNMQLYRPEDFEDACQLDEAIRYCGGMRGDVYLYRRMVPLRTVDFRNDVDRGQGLLFDILPSAPAGGCESGHCFV